MEYEFKKNTLDGQYYTNFSMGHEVIGRWLLEEMGTDKTKIAALQDDIKQVGISHTEWRHLGQHYSVLLQDGEITILANSLLQESDVLDERHTQQDLDYYDDEMTADCGVEDFFAMLEDWIEFTHSR